MQKGIQRYIAQFKRGFHLAAGKHFILSICAAVSIISARADYANYTRVAVRLFLFKCIPPVFLRIRNGAESLRCAFLFRLLLLFLFFIIIWMAVVLVVINRGRVKYGESHLFSLGSL